MEKKTIGLSEKVNLIELSDAFRRHAEFDDPRLAQGMVHCSREFLGLLSHYYPEHSELPENKETANSLKRVLYVMIGMAAAAEVDEIVLPVGGDNPFADFLRHEVLDKLVPTWDVKLSLQEETYSSDRSDIGPIDKSIRTVLDEGMRGLVNIKPQLLRRWDM